MAQPKNKLVILGSGWAGYNIARQVDKSLYDVTIISPSSYFSFTPFLASAAVGTLEYKSATESVRAIKNIKFAQGWANEVDFARQKIEVEPAWLEASGPPSHFVQTKTEVDKTQPVNQKYEVEYDTLIITVGCYSATYGTPGVSRYAHYLKDIRDARAIRNRIIERFEQAVIPNLTDEQRRELLQFSVVGGGPTGVEFAAELHDFVKEDVYKKYPTLKGLVGITLYDVAPDILMSFNEQLRKYAVNRFKRQGVEVRTKSKITSVGQDYLELDDGDGKTHRDPFGLLVWNTGLSPNPLMDKIAKNNVKQNEKTKSLIVNDHLTVLDKEGKPIKGVFAAGDNAMPQSGAIPATGQVADQEANWMSRTLNKMARGAELETLPVFKWKNKGSMVLIGDQKGLMDRSQDSISGPRMRLSGYLAWLAWRGYYLTLSRTWKNSILVPIYFALTWAFGRDVSRF